MVNSSKKDGAYIFIVRPENEEEHALVDRLLKADRERQKERDYWTLPTVKPRQMEMDEMYGFVPISDKDIDLPFS